MSQTVGELFVDLGVKGSDKTLGAISGIKKGLGETASVSLEAKAAIVGAMYAAEQLFAKSGAVGMGLANFNALTGESAQVLQTFQNAGRQAGISADTMAGSFTRLQSTIANVRMGKAPPEMFGAFSTMVGNIDEALPDLEKHGEKIYAYAQKFIHEAAAKGLSAGVRNNILRSVGFSDSEIAGLARGMFDPAALARAAKMPHYSDPEIKSLQRAQAAWLNLGNTISVAVGKFNAKEGGKLVKDITGLVDPVLKLASAFQTLADKVGLFAGFSHVIEGMANSIKLIDEIINRVSGGESSKGDLLYNGGKGNALPGYSGSRLDKFFQMVHDLAVGTTGSVSDGSALTIPLPATTDTIHHQTTNHHNVNVNIRSDNANAGRDAAHHIGKQLEKFKNSSSAQSRNN